MREKESNLLKLRDFLNFEKLDCFQFNFSGVSEELKGMLNDMKKSNFKTQELIA